MRAITQTARTACPANCADRQKGSVAADTMMPSGFAATATALAVWPPTVLITPSNAAPHHALP